MSERTLIACLCLVVLAGGCGEEKPKKEAWQKREQVYTDKTPEEWLKLIRHHNVQVRNRAIDALIQYRKDGQDHVPALVDILDSSKSGQVRLSVARALGGMGADAKAGVPALCKALRDAGWQQRDGAAEALGTIRQNLEQTVPVLVAALGDDTDERVRGKAAQALGRIRTGDPQAVAALTAALEDADTNVQAEAARALGYIGPKAKSAIPALEKAAQSEYFVVNDAAQRALARISHQR